MVTLPKKILNSYQNNPAQLTLDKRFHFNSRLFLWYQHNQALEDLKKIKNEYIGGSQEEIKIILTKQLQKRPDQDHSFYTLRKKCFSIYPQLVGFNNVLFKALYAETIYDQNLRPQIKQLIDTKNLINLEQKLTADVESVANLSTLAINYLYILNKHYLKNNKTKKFIRLAQTAFESSYDFTDMNQLCLAAYLITHCVIGETSFYSKKPKHKKLLKEMLLRLGSLISQNYFSFTLDIKLEFIVCCHICQLKHALEPIILDEARKSETTKNNLTFIRDKFTNNPKSINSNFEDSEHRNVLYLLALNDPQILAD